MPSAPTTKVQTPSSLHPVPASMAAAPALRSARFCKTAVRAASYSARRASAMGFHSLSSRSASRGDGGGGASRVTRGYAFSYASVAEDDDDGGLLLAYGED